MKNIFITGASGYLGGKIARALSAHEQVQHIVGLDIRKPDFQLDNFTFFNQDVREPVTDILKDYDIDTVIHAAYVFAPGHDTKNIEDINVCGTKNIFNCAMKAGISQILYTSSTTAYGFHADNDIPLTESSPLRGNDDLVYSKNKKEIESIVKMFAQDNPGICVTVLRPCYVAGPGLDNPMSTHLKKPFVLLPRKTKPFQYVHEDDLVRIMILCLEKRLDGIFNVAGEGTLSFPEMIRILGNIPVPVPDFLLRFLNGTAWHLRLKFLTEFPNAALNLMKYSWIATSEKLIKKTGYTFKYDTRTAYADFAKHVLTQKRGKR